MKENLIIVVVVLIAIISSVVIAVGLIYGVSRPQCLTAYSEYQPQWGFWSKCRIMWKGALTPTSIITNINY